MLLVSSGSSERRFPGPAAGVARRLGLDSVPAIDLPMAGDRVYGIAGELGLERQFLHAARLAFEHPVTGAAVDVSSPLPPDLATALAAARS